jgi:hypothetical protein
VRAFRTLLLAATAVAVSACGATGTAATVGDETITIAAVQNEIIDFSESFDEPLPLSGDLASVQQQFLNRDINHLLLIEMADREGVEITDAEVDALFDDLEAQSNGDIDALRAQFIYTEAGLRRALEDELRLQGLEPIVGDIEPAIVETAEQIGVEVNPRFGTWEGATLVPGTGSISVPAG